MRKLFTFFLALVTVAAVADDLSSVLINGLYYDLNTESSTATVVAKPSGKYTGDITIPPSVEYNSETFSVTAIVNAFYDCADLTSVTLPNSVRNISDYSFYGCSSLESIVANDKIFARLPMSYSGSYTIPEGIQTIAGNAFQKCANLESVTIPKSVTSMGERPFPACYSLTAIEVAAGNTVYVAVKGVLFSKDKKMLVAFPGGKTGSYNVPSGVEVIGNAAFISSNLETVNLPNSVQTIEEDAFFSCYKLTRVNIPNGVTSIGRYAFAHSNKLPEIVIGSGVKSIGAYAFYTCSALKSITCKAVEPPTCPDETVFKGTDKNACLYVPQESISSYRKAKGWSALKDNTYPMAEAIGHVTNNATSTSRKIIRDGQVMIERGGMVYDLRGQMVE